MEFSSTQEILAELHAGRMVVIVDDEDRENEGDLLMLASHVRPEDVNFMAKYGRGLICLTLTRERCRQLALPLMVTDTNDSHGTNFTVSIEAAEGVTTGISAYDRAHTIRTAVAPNAVPTDLVQPGHVFPLMAQPGGVLVRAGHTEAGCDLARLAGAEPAAVIVEILNEDGSMARRPDLERFCAQHGLKMGTIEALIRYRIENEKTVRRAAEVDLPTAHGVFRLIAFQDEVDRGLHFALVRGPPEAQRADAGAGASRADDLRHPGLLRLRLRLAARRRAAPHRRGGCRRRRGPAQAGGVGRADPPPARPRERTRRPASAGADVGRLAHVRHRCPDPRRRRHRQDAPPVRPQALPRSRRIRPGGRRLRPEHPPLQVGATSGRDRGIVLDPAI
jgi:3,4-dihydroxy-2-butanone 4-phosphate synthase